MAVLRMLAGRHGEAVRFAGEAVALNRSRAAALSEYRDRLFRAVALGLLGDSSRMREDLTVADSLAQSPAIAPEWLVFLGRLQARSGWIELAERTLRSIVARADSGNRDDQEALAELHAEIALARGRPDVALRHLEPLAAERGSALVLDGLARAHRMQGDVEQAVRQYQQIIARRAFGTERQLPWMLAHYELGRIALERADTAQAMIRFGEFVELWKDGDPEAPALADARRYLEGLRKGRTVR
jgi:tetratricopeptide (TPR) repeat protein